MDARRVNLPLLVGLLVSLALHAWALLPALVSSMSGPRPRAMALARFSPDDLRPPPRHPDETDPVRLGLEEGSPSTITWIGYEEYREHLARLDAVEQAAFEDDPAGADGAPAAPVLPAANPVTSAALVPGELASSTGAPPPAEIDDLVPPAALLEPDEASARHERGATVEAPGAAELAEVLAALIRPLGLSLRLPAPDVLADPRDAAHLRDPADGRDEPTPNPTPTESPEAPGGAAAANAAAAQPADAPGPPHRGAKADKEADPSSIVEVALDQIRPGQPLAARGLELLPRRPQFTTLQRITASVGNPLVEIRFGKDGVPRKALILVSTGNRGIDVTIEASLYRWRASGQPLEALGDDETLDLRIRILLTSRGRP